MKKSELRQMIKEEISKLKEENNFDKYAKDAEYVVYGQGEKDKKLYIIKFCKTERQAHLWRNRIDKQHSYHNKVDKDEEFNNWGWKLWNDRTKAEFKNAIYTNGKIVGYK